MTPRTRRAGVVGGVAAAALAAAESARRRWAATPDPTGGRPLCLPDGEDRVVVTADGARLAVRVAGPADGATIVLAHCWVGDRRFWGPVAERLVAAGRRVVLYDHRGHGRSTVGSAGFTLGALASDLAAVLDAVDAKGAVVVGHSMGGMAAQLLAARDPDVFAARAAGLVLVSTACDRARSGAFGRLPNIGVSGPHASLLLGSAAFGPLFVRATVGRTAALSHLEAVCQTYVATQPRVRHALLVEMAGMDLCPLLPRISVPVLVVVGSRDLLTPPARSRRIAELVPGARLEVLPDVGHMAPVEAPDRVTELVLDHARRAGAGRTARRAV